ncbi:hypothetical protein GQ55_6G190500 [Panicum hallii var. hallii]|uniref:Uncharacterized protein n=1 Tax=Panicum hallii var. hallii TaxID=1504633 RepID=A0A2T7D7B5_9POAL|nr:hypothetical protein GQ55_6G190500 [Panicum hallii var. hallii]PUZ51477.1 hypothetical protein GQ55_6G190500 [Panicum hallii var. hallii]
MRAAAGAPSLPLRISPFSFPSFSSRRACCTSLLSLAAGVLFAGCARIRHWWVRIRGLLARGGKPLAVPLGACRLKHEAARPPSSAVQDGQVLVPLLDFDARPWPCAIPGGELLVPFVAASFAFRVLRAMSPVAEPAGARGWRPRRLVSCVAAGLRHSGRSGGRRRFPASQGPDLPFGEGAHPWPRAIPGGVPLLPLVAASCGLWVLRATPPLRGLRKRRGMRPRQHVACVATGLPFLPVAFLAAPCSAMFWPEWFVMVLGLALPRGSSCSGRHGGSLVCPQWQRGTLLCLCSSRFVYGVLGLDRAGESVAPGARGGIPPLLGPPVPGARAFIGRCAAKASRSVRGGGGCAGRCFTFAHVTAPAEFLESPASSLFVLFLDLLDFGRWPLPWFGECSSSAPLLRRSSSCWWHRRIKCQVLYLSTSSVVPL